MNNKTILFFLVCAVLLAGFACAPNRSEDSGDFDTMFIPRPVLLVPQDMSDDRDTAFTVRWSFAGADSLEPRYTLYLDTVNPPDSVYAQNMADTSFDIRGLDDSTTYYWRVYVSVEDSGVFSETARFETFVPPIIYPDWNVYTLYNSDLPENDLLSIAVDSAGAVWIGTRKKGLVRFDGSSWRSYTLDNSDIPGDAVYSVAFDARERLWAGTHGGGLVRFDGQAWTQYRFDAAVIDSADILHDEGLRCDVSIPQWVFSPSRPADGGVARGP